MSQPTLNSTNLCKRFATQEIAHIEIYGRTGKILTRMGNLSESGAFFEILTPNFILLQGDIARITITLRSLNKTHVKDCEVVWIKNLSVGVKFMTREQLQNKLTQVILRNKFN